MVQSSSQKTPHIAEILSRRIPLNNLQIILIALVIVSGRLIIDFSQRILEGQSKIAEQNALEAKITELTQEQRDLEATKSYYGSPAYVEAWAHDHGKMVREGEVLVIPAYDKYARSGLTVTSLEPVRPMPVWQVWWSLFFDTSAPSGSQLQSSEGRR